MTWSNVERDWDEFLNALSHRLPYVDLQAAPLPDKGLDAFCGFLARAGEMTRAEAEDLVLTLVLPAWLNRQTRQTLIAAE
ncbi:MAG: hypothetical protein RIE60_18405 [Roseovarius sp.]|uniref:hypothetical protein n=1 Tax=Roseovarius sp. TaxID=1486281 RepID=UPI0032EEEAF2